MTRLRILIEQYKPLRASKRTRSIQGSAELQEHAIRKNRLIACTIAQGPQIENIFSNTCTPSKDTWSPNLETGSFPSAATERAMEASSFSFYPSTMLLLCWWKVQMTKLVADLLLCEGGLQASLSSASSLGGFLSALECCSDQAFETGIDKQTSASWRGKK